MTMEYVSGTFQSKVYVGPESEFNTWLEEHSGDGLFDVPEEQEDDKENDDDDGPSCFAFFPTSTQQQQSVLLAKGHIMVAVFFKIQ